MRHVLCFLLGMFVQFLLFATRLVEITFENNL